MILSFRDDWLRAFFVGDVRSRNIPPDLANRLFRKLQMLDDATTDRDLRVPPSNHFEKLLGKLEGFHAIRVNNQWRAHFPLGWPSRRSNRRLSRRPQLSVTFVMLLTKRKPPTVRAILV